MASIIKRVNPHLERIKRNRLHPRHLEVTATAVFMGPNGIIRKNPHKVGFIGPNGLKRIDRANLNQASGAAGQQANAVAEQKPLHVIAEPTRFIVVVPDLAAGRLSSHDKDVFGLAQQLADEHTAVIGIAFSDHKETGWQDVGADRLLHLQEAAFAGFSPEARVAALQQLNQNLDVTHFLFPDSVDGGADLGRRLAAKLACRPATHGWKLDGEALQCRAAAGAKDVTKPLTQVMLLDSEIADPIDENQHQALPLELDIQFPEHILINDAGMLAVDPSEISLAESPFILSGGNGIRNWETFHQASTLLGATEGASRVAVDDGFMPRHRQVGATGTWVTARVYIAVGISGAVQHLQGIGQVDKVIAINTEAGCDMVKRADLSIIADSTDILAALIELVNQATTTPLIEETEHAA